MASDGFEAIREEEIIIPIVPLQIIEPTDDVQLVSASTPSAPPPPQPQVKTKRSKTNVILKQQNIPARENLKKSQTGKPGCERMQIFALNVLIY